MKQYSKGWLVLALPLLVVGLLAVGLASPVQAADFRGGETIVIQTGEVVDDDLWVGANRVQVNGVVTGDLWAGGNEVVVNGQVDGSVFLAGQTLELNGPVGGSVYVGGYALTMGPQADIEGNVYFGGFSLITEPESTVGRSLYAGGYQILLNGDVADDVEVGAAALELDGSVGGDVTGEVAESGQTTSLFIPSFPGSVSAVDPGLRVSERADIGGEMDVIETAGGDFDISLPSVSSIVIGGLAQSVRDRIGEFIALLIVGGLLLALWPGIVKRSQDRAGQQPITSAGWGCGLIVVFLVGVPIACLATLALAGLGGLVTFGQLFGAILTLGWAALGLLVAVFFFTLFLVAKVIVAFLVGRWSLDRLAPNRQAGYWADFASLAVGAFIYEIVRFIPILGWLVAVVVILVGLGAIYFVLRDTFRPARTKEVAETAPVA